LSQAALNLKARDRLGLITFSDAAQYVVQLNDEPTRARFRDVLATLKTSANTDLLAPIQKAREVLRNDDAEEQLIVVLSDGIKTTTTPDEDVLKAVAELCPEPAEAGAPRRTSVFTFGIGADPRDNPVGEKLMKDIAAAGGGTYSNEFTQLAERLEQALESRNSGFYKRREACAVRAASVHPLLERIGREWPATLPFRNRVQAKLEADTLLASAPVRDSNAKGARRPDPLLALSGAAWPGAGRCAAAMFSWDGDDGEALLAATAGRNLLRTLLEWAEGADRTMPAGYSLIAEPSRDGDLVVELRAADAEHQNQPANGLALQALLKEVESEEDKPAITAKMVAVAPGVYRVKIRQPAAGRVHKLVVSEGARVFPERFVTMPFSAETTQLGVDRGAMRDLIRASGGDVSTQSIERPQHLKDWIEARKLSQAMQSLLPWLTAVGLAVLLGIYVGRRN
jgi:hypothetical protein